MNAIFVFIFGVFLTWCSIRSWGWWTIAVLPFIFSLCWLVFGALAPEHVE